MKKEACRPLFDNDILGDVRLFLVGLDFCPFGVIADVADEAETANTFS